MKRTHQALAMIAVLGSVGLIAAAATPPADALDAERLVVVLAEQGVPVIDRTAGIPETRHPQLVRIREGAGAGEVAVLELTVDQPVLALFFDNERAMVATASNLPEYLCYGEVLFMPTVGADDSWETLVEAIEGLGGFHHSAATEERHLALARVQSQLRMLRLLTQTFRAMHGADPEFAATQWHDLLTMDGSLLRAAPMNPFSPAGAAAQIVVAEAAGVDGKAVAPDIAGWVWNTADGTLHAAGFSDGELEAARRSLERPNRLLTAGTRAALLLSQLQAVRAQVELYRMAEEAVPDFAGADPWAPLVDGRYLEHVPANPFAHAGVAGRLVVTEWPGATGESIPVTEGGWVWNAADGILYGAGFTDEQLFTAAGSPPPGREITAERSLKSRMAQIRIEIANFRANRSLSGRAAWPTLDQLRQAGFVAPQIPVNPINGQAAIQALDWNGDAPPVTGDAGWNYDPTRGHLWANTDTMGENEF